MRAEQLSSQGERGMIEGWCCSRRRAIRGALERARPSLLVAINVTVIFRSRLASRDVRNDGRKGKMPGSESDSSSPTGAGLLFLLALALGGVGIYRLRNGKGGAGLLKATMVISLILIIA